MKKHVGKNKMGGPVKMVCSQAECKTSATGIAPHLGRRHKQCRLGGIWKAGQLDRQ